MQKQSIQHIGASCLLIMGAGLLSVGEGSIKGSSGGNPDRVLFYGIVPDLVASVLSGLASSLCQWELGYFLKPKCYVASLLTTTFFCIFPLKIGKHSSYSMTVEMSIVGGLCLLVSTLKSPDREAIKRHGFFQDWTTLTLVLTSLTLSFRTTYKIPL